MILVRSDEEKEEQIELKQSEEWKEYIRNNERIYNYAWWVKRD